MTRRLSRDSKLVAFVVGAAVGGPAGCVVMYMAHDIASLLLGPFDIGVSMSIYNALDEPLLLIGALGCGLLAAARPGKPRHIVLFTSLGLIAGYNVGMIASLLVQVFVYSRVASYVTHLTMTLLGAALGALTGVWWARRSTGDAMDTNGTM